MYISGLRTFILSELSHSHLPIRIVGRVKNRRGTKPEQIQNTCIARDQTVADRDDAIHIFARRPDFLELTRLVKRIELPLRKSGNV